MFRVKKRCGYYFTLIETICAFTCFTLLTVVVIKFYGQAAHATSRASEQCMTFENARIALELITRDLHSVYHKSCNVPFWHWKPDTKPSSWGAYRNELLAFVSLTSVLPNKNCKSHLCEIKYQLYYATNKKDSNDGWLRRSVTGDYTSTDVNEKWNFMNNLNVGYSTDILGENASAFTANSTSGESYQKVIPYVLNLNFNCFDKNGNLIDPDKNISNSENSGSVTGFPYSIEVILNVMDKESWKKWQELFPDYPNDESVAAKLFRRENEREFKKTIFIGDRC